MADMPATSLSLRTVTLEFEPDHSVMRPSLRLPGENGDVVVRGANAYFPPVDVRRLADFLRVACVSNDLSALPYNPFVNLDLTFELTVESVDGYGDGDGELTVRVMLVLPTDSDEGRSRFGIEATVPFSDIRKAAKMLEGLAMPT